MNTIWAGGPRVRINQLVNKINLKLPRYSKSISVTDNLARVYDSAIIICRSSDFAQLILFLLTTGCRYTICECDSFSRIKNFRDDVHRSNLVVRYPHNSRLASVRRDVFEIAFRTKKRPQTHY